MFILYCTPWFSPAIPYNWEEVATVVNPNLKIRYCRICKAIYIFLLLFLLKKSAVQYRLADMPYFHFPFGCHHGDISFSFPPLTIYLHCMMFEPYKPYIFWKLIIWWDIDRDEDLQKDKYKDTQTQTNTKCQDPIYAIFFISREFKDLKIYIDCLLVMTQTKTKTKTQFLSLLGVNIFQVWIFFRCEYFSGGNIF